MKLRPSAPPSPGEPPVWQILTPILAMYAALLLLHPLVILDSQRYQQVGPKPRAARSRARGAPRNLAVLKNRRVFRPSLSLSLRPRRSCSS